MTADKRKRSPGRPKAADQASSMRDTVLRAASRLFMERGYEPVSMQEVADAAGVTKASVYYYFVNKAELFAVAIAEMMKRVAAATKDILAGDGDLRSRLEKVAAAKLAGPHVEFESMMREAAASLAKEQQEAIREAERGVHAALAECFRKEMAQGSVSAAMSPMLLAQAFAALLTLGNRREALAEEVGDEALPKLLTDLFLRGAAPAGERPTS